MRLVEVLEAGRRDFAEATGKISAEQATARTDPKSWTVLECIEHVTTVEERYLSWIAEGTVITPKPDPDKEMRLFTAVRNRLTKVEAPEPVRPSGRFRTLEEALAAFSAVRDRSVQLVRERGDALYSIGARHPFFGKVNGAELIQLMDGHARRHADQIREICEAGASTRKTRRKPPAARVKAPAFRRDTPDLPSVFEPNGNLEQLFAAGDLIEIREMHLQQAERGNLNVHDFRIEGSVLEGVQLGGGQFGSAVWKDVRLTGCDLANIRAHRFVLKRVEFIDCRLTGLSTAALDCQDVLIQNGDMRYTQFRGGLFRNCEFNECNWQEADLQEADLTGSVFRSCNLERADFQGATLNKTDLRGSEVEGMMAGMHDLRGAIVDAPQALVFARLLGLQIR